MALIDKASLLMVPSTYEDGTLYNVLPSGNKAPDETGNHNGYDQTRADFSFTRGSNLAATRRNSSGLIEKGRENLLLQSNAFDTTWGKSNVTLTSGHEGYDGTNNAWKLIQTTTAGYHFISQSVTSSSLMTLSIYAKAGEYSALSFYQNNASESSVASTFNLSNGTWTTKNHIAKSTDVGNGWYRLEIVTKDSGTDAYRFYVNQTTQQSEAGDGTSGIYIQNAQLEKSMVATDYIETGSTTAQAGILEDMPRINYDANGENGALLLEPSRTNLVTYSEYFEHSLWDSGATTADVSKSPNLSPEGVANCYYVENVSGGQLGFYTTITSGASYTGSFWVRKVSGSGVVRMINVNNSGTDFNVGTEWTRVSVTATSTSTTGRCYVQAKNTGDIIEVYGAQLEAGSYPSSYVPTYGSAVTRSADSCSVTGVSDVIGQSEGTLFIEFDHRYMASYPNEYIIDLEDSTHKLWIRKESAGNTLTSRLIVSGSNVWTIGISATDGIAKIALAYKSGDSAVYYNGTQIGTSSGTFSGSSFSKIYFNLVGSSNPELKAKNLTLYKERLSNSELADLTS